MKTDAVKRVYRIFFRERHKGNFDYVFPSIMKGKKLAGFHLHDPDTMIFIFDVGMIYFGKKIYYH